MGKNLKYIQKQKAKYAWIYKKQQQEDRGLNVQRKKRGAETTTQPTQKLIITTRENTLISIHRHFPPYYDYRYIVTDYFLPQVPSPVWPPTQQARPSRRWI